ncbi:MAG: cation transporter [Gemmatimonadetes bacterium]|nr:cation transporter [Gemmatimonadota bacterium]
MVARVASDYAVRESRHREIRRVLAWTLLANLAVVAAKAAGGLLAHTLSVVAEAAHSSVDAWNNLLGLALARVAARAPDEEHPYGHAKFETLGALGVVAFLSVSVFELVSAAIGRLVTGAGRPEATPFVVAAMVGSAVVSAVVSRYEARRGRELGSEILLADAAHTRSDVYASLGVLVGLGLVAAGYPRADAAFTLLVALVIARAGWRILKTTVPVLVDQRAVEARTIRRIALDTPGVKGAYAVRSRGREGEIFAELTIAVSRKLDVESAHAIADEVERRVAREVSAREVVVHVEPDSGLTQQGRRPAGPP